MNKSKILKGIIAILLAVNILGAAACSGKTSSTATGTTVYGKVTKVEGKNITMTVGTWNGGGQGGNNQGTPPSNSNNQGTPPTGNQGSQQGTPHEMLTLTNEAKTITVSDTSIIKKQSMAAPETSNDTSKSSTSTSASLPDITAGSILKLTYDTSGKLSSVEIIGGMAGSGTPGGTNGGSGSPTVTGTGAYTTSGTASDQKITASKDNQSGIKISDGKTLTITNSSITTSGKTTSEEESNFYGLNAGVLSSNKSSITLKNSSIVTTGEGANAAFAYGSGGVVSLDNVTINTSGNSARGLDATYGGIVLANKVTISTKGAHCASIATDRGEGTVTVTNSKAVTSGTDSPAVYCTGKITVSDSTLTSTGSEAMVIEGKNSITLKNCQAAGTVNNGVMIYQSTSGDAAEGTGNLSITGGTLSSKAGAMFFITNTDAVITLNNTKLSGGDTLINAAATTRWGTSGSNGGRLTLTANEQLLSGDVTADKISTVTMILNKSAYSGTVNMENTAKSIALTLSKDSTWNVTGTSYITALTDSDTNLSNIKDNGNTIYYDSSDSSNSWLNGKTLSLSGGGKLISVTK
jgi:hypothetical protein